MLANLNVTYQRKLLFVSDVWVDHAEFLVAEMRLYMSLCRSVHPSVYRRLVGPSDLRIVGKRVEISIRLFDIFERNMVFIFL